MMAQVVEITADSSMTSSAPAKWGSCKLAGDSSRVTQGCVQLLHHPMSHKGCQAGLTYVVPLALVCRET